MPKMLRFFKQPVKQPEPEEEEHVDTPENLFHEPPLHSHSWNTYTVSYYCVKARTVAPYLSSWCFNRRMNEVHMNDIKNDLVTQRTPHLMGAIQLVRDQSKNVRVINGQHRLKAIEEILRADLDMTFDMPLFFEIYDVPIVSMEDIESDTRIIEDLFRRANNSLNYTPEDDHELFCRKVVKAMQQDTTLQKGIVDKTTGKVMRPRILAKDLYELLKEHMPREHGSINDVIQSIKRINVDISMMPNIRLFGRHAPSEMKTKQRAKATENGFFLNLDSKFTPDVWIASLAY
jgi:hypothetical protein